MNRIKEYNYCHTSTINSHLAEKYESHNILKKIDRIIQDDCKKCDPPTQYKPVFNDKEAIDGDKLTQVFYSGSNPPKSVDMIVVIVDINNPSHEEYLLIENKLNVKKPKFFSTLTEEKAKGTKTLIGDFYQRFKYLPLQAHEKYMVLFHEQHKAVVMRWQIQSKQGEKKFTSELHTPSTLKEDFFDEHMPLLA